MVDAKMGGERWTFRRVGMERGGGRIKMEGEGEELRWRVRGRGGGTQLYKRPETLTQSAIMMFSRGP